MKSMQLGNGKWESTTFNSRLQPTQIALGTVQNGTDKLKLNFEYNSSGQNDNNGNVSKQTITTPTTGSTTGFTAIQTYNYDEVNRLKSAEENIANVTSWKQTFTFDRYGNKRFDTGNDVDGDKTTTLDSNCATAVCNPTIDPATNKLVGYTFDNAGNTKVDATGQIFTYDAENKQILVKDANGNTIGEYFYDGDGKRVKKIANSEETIFVYNASGQLIADYATQISQTPKVSYLTSDHLGSPRITTDANGDIYTRRDFMPFGEEIDSSHTSQRSVGLNYATDEIRQKFTSYERDNETELDFAQARMHNYNLGRFNSPDPILMKKKRLVDPQAINLYVYVRNNPLMYVDPDGEEFKGTGGNRVIIEREDGQWVIRSDNASKDLKRLVGLINNSGSSTANSQFKRLNAHETMINFAFGDRDPQGVAGARHQPHGTRPDGKKGALDFKNGKFEGQVDIVKDSNGNEIYAEATITIFEGEYKASPGSTEESINEGMVAAFGHEAEHDLDPAQVQETKNGTYRDSVYHARNPNGTQATGSPYWVSGQIRKEIQENRRVNRAFNQLYNNGGCLVPNF